MALNVKKVASRLSQPLFLRTYFTFDAYVSEFVGTFCWVITLCSLGHILIEKDVGSPGVSPEHQQTLSHMLSQSPYEDSLLRSFPFEHVKPLRGVNATTVSVSKGCDLSQSSCQSLVPVIAASEHCHGSILLSVSVSIVFGLLLYLLSGFSAGHFNPAVTYAHWLSHATRSFVARNKLDFIPFLRRLEYSKYNYASDPARGCSTKTFDSIRTSIYICFQYLGALCGSTAAWRFTKKPFMIVPVAPYGIVGAFVSEFIGSGLLVYVMLFLGNAKSRQPKGSLIATLYGAIGSLTFLGIGLVSSRFSLGGPSLNPALTSSLVSAYVAQYSVAVFDNWRWVSVIPYWLGPYGGATLAALLYSMYPLCYSADVSNPYILRPAASASTEATPSCVVESSKGRGMLSSSYDSCEKTSNVDGALDSLTCTEHSPLLGSPGCTLDTNYCEDYGRVWT
eukprot:GHVQ01012738.1.p1 GENE.GHVQ01012738.1~~GHVQ01012738.1.p1  ORF type:complete len:449 (-),score=23.10 GHVQ01012738.1:1497-2843(-)